MTSTVDLKKFNYEVNTFISDAEARKKFHKALKDFLNERNIIKFTNELAEILDRPERLRMYDVLRPLIPLRQQMEYNMLVPYINNKQRIIQLRRRKEVTSFGFAIRGGREHGIGIFVSDVDEGSEASRQGLKVGDQIMSVNGLDISQAIHEEVINLMNKPRNNILQLVVRSVGMIPVQNSQDASPDLVPENQRPKYFLQQFVPNNQDSVIGSPSPKTPNSVFSDSYVISPTSPPLPSPTQLFPLTPARSPTSSVSSHVSSLILSPSSTFPTALNYDQILIQGKHLDSRSKGVLSWKAVTPKEWPRLNTTDASTSSDNYQDVKAFLTFQPNQKFGCNICKGPTDRPGIYIQSTTEGGLAHQVGLRTGDKLLEANGKDLQNMDFREAVDYLKSCKYVELVVRRGVGVDLFPGESSGYNSSSSSTVGDHSTTLVTTATTEAVEMTTVIDVSDSGGPPSDDRRTENVIEGVQTTEVVIPNTAVAKEVVADVIVHKAENHIAAQPRGTNGNESNFDPREDERRMASILRYQQQREEMERKKKEAEEEKRRNLEYISRMEVVNIDDELINKGNFQKDSLLLLSHRGSMELIQDDVPLNGIQEEEEESGNGTQDQEVQQRMESTEKMVRTAEVLMDKALSRSSSNSSGGDSGLHMKEDEHKENEINENDKWKKTVLAQIHNTPRPSVTNENGNQERERKNSQYSQSSQSQYSTRESNKSSDISNERRNEMQKRSQHDQVIEEFRQTHKKMFALVLEKNKNLALQGEKDQEYYIEIIEPVTRRRPAPLQPNLIEQRNRKSSQIFSPPVSLQLEEKALNEARKTLKPCKTTSYMNTYATQLRRGTLLQPTANPEPHKFVQTPQVGMMTQDPMSNRPQSKVFQPPKTPMFGTSITDSTPMAPRPPAFYYPESKPKIVINPYVSSNARPAPKRLEYLEHHPSVATVEFKLNDPPKKALVKPSEPQVSPSYVTKVAINKPEPKPSPAPALPAQIIKKPPVSPASTVNVTDTVLKTGENKKNNLKNSTDQSKEVINGEAKATINGEAKATINGEAKATINGEAKATINGEAKNSERIGFNTARMKFMNGVVIANPPFEKPKPAVSIGRAVSPAIQNSLFKFQNKPEASVAVNGGNAFIKATNNSNGNSKIASRIERRQRQPSVGDNKVAFQMPNDSMVIIEPSN